MTRHCLKVVWNRRRASGLLVAEMALSFLVLCAVALMAVYSLDRYLQPLGFEYEDVWRVFAKPEDGAAAIDMAQIRQGLVDLEEVVAVGHADRAGSPFGGYWSRDGFNQNGQHYEVNQGYLSDEVGEVLRFEPIAGRWFEPADEALEWDSVVITDDLRQAVFGDEDPLGKAIGAESGENMRVVGVIADYRKGGEFAETVNFRIVRLRSADLSNGTFLIRVRPGTPARFEATVLAHLRSRARGWTIEAGPLARDRAFFFKARLVMIGLAGIVSAFLLLMVALGLVGVLWQSVTQRTRELGLRRAVGATAAAIRWQVLGELLVLTTIAVVLGTVVVAQVPLFELVSGMSTQVYAGALAASLAVLYSLVILCGLYPSWLATRVQPAQALHYE